MYLTGSKSPPGTLQAVRAAGGRIWSPNFNDIDAAKLKEAREFGLAVIVWTVNEPVQIAATAVVP